MNDGVVVVDRLGFRRQIGLQLLRDILADVNRAQLADRRRAFQEKNPRDQRISNKSAPV